MLTVERQKRTDGWRRRGPPGVPQRSSNVAHDIRGRSLATARRRRDRAPSLLRRDDAEISRWVAPPRPSAQTGSALPDSPSDGAGQHGVSAGTAVAIAALR